MCACERCGGTYHRGGFTSQTSGTSSLVAAALVAARNSEKTEWNLQAAAVSALLFDDVPAPPTHITCPNWGPHCHAHIPRKMRKECQPLPTHPISDLLMLESLSTLPWKTSETFCSCSIRFSMGLYSIFFCCFSNSNYQEQARLSDVPERQFALCLFQLSVPKFKISVPERRGKLDGRDGGASFHARCLQRTRKSMTTGTMSTHTSCLKTKGASR
jgi:hypothetical protein